MVIQHSSASNEHYTPIEYVDAAREVMGGIDLDPATTESVNTNRVRAGYFFTQADNGLEQNWFGRTLLNPPGGKYGNKSSAVVWYSKLVDEWLSGAVSQAVFIGFSIEQLSTTQSVKVPLIHLPFCVPSSRIDFDKEIAPGEYEEGGSPSHANVIAYLPPRDDPWAVFKFAEVFSRFGAVR